MTAQDIADRYWQQAPTSRRLDKALKLAERSQVDADTVLRLIERAGAYAGAHLEGPADVR